MRSDVVLVGQLDVISYCSFNICIFYNPDNREIWSMNQVRWSFSRLTRCYCSFDISAIHLYYLWYLTDANELQISKWQKHLVGDKLGQTNNYHIKIWSRFNNICCFDNWREISQWTHEVRSDENCLKTWISIKLFLKNNYCINKFIKIQQYLLFRQPKEL